MRYLYIITVLTLAVSHLQGESAEILGYHGEKFEMASTMTSDGVAVRIVDSIFIDDAMVLESIAIARIGNRLHVPSQRNYLISIVDHGLGKFVVIGRLSGGISLVLKLDDNNRYVAIDSKRAKEFLPMFEALFRNPDPE